MRRGWHVLAVALISATIQVLWSGGVLALTVEEQVNVLIHSYVEQRDAQMYEEALATILDAKRLRPDSAAVVGFVGEGYVNAEKYVDAIVTLRRRIGLGSEHPSDRRNLAFALSKVASRRAERGEEADAQRLWNEAMTVAPEDAYPYYSRGAFYQLELLEFEQAISEYTRAIELDPQWARPYHGRGLSYWATDQDQKALADLDKAIEVDNHFAEAYETRGFVHSYLGNTDQALKDYGKAIEVDPECAEWYLSRGWQYYDLSEYEKAAADFTKAVEFAPEDEDAHDFRARTLVELGEYRQAIADFTRAVELAREHDRDYDECDWLRRRAIAYFCAGDVRRARGDIERAVARAARHGKLVEHFVLCRVPWTMLELGWYEEALPYTRIAGRTGGSAAILLGLGRLDEAEQYIQTAVEVDPDYPVCQAVYAAILAAGGHERDARLRLQKALDAEGSIIVTSELREWVCYFVGLTYQALGEKEEAAAAFERALELAPRLARTKGLAEVIKDLRGQ